MSVSWLVLALALAPTAAQAHHREPPVAAVHQPYWNGFLLAALAALVLLEVAWALRRRGGAGSAWPPRGEGGLPPSVADGVSRVERVWTLAPLGVLITLLLFLGVSRATAPMGGLQVVAPANIASDAVEVRVQARQFSWTFDYGKGVRSSRELHLPLGRDARLRLTAVDALHSFDLPAGGVKTDLPYGVETVAGLRADRIGRWEIVCSALCGKTSDEMEAVLVVEAPGDYARWLESQRVGDRG